jgi:hypothetical protein
MVTCGASVHPTLLRAQPGVRDGYDDTAAFTSAARGVYSLAGASHAALPPPPSVPFGPGDTPSVQVRWVVDGTPIQADLDGVHDRVGSLGRAAHDQLRATGEPWMITGAVDWLHQTTLSRCASQAIALHASPLGDPQSIRAC